MEVRIVLDRFGRKYFVSEEDLKNGHSQLPLYTKNGTKFVDTEKGQKALRNSKAVSIHRTNIQIIVPQNEFTKLL